ncbi:phage integrase SAM-like domain-containing protein [Hymenobacter tenuis]
MQPPLLWRVNNQADPVTGKAPIYMRIKVGPQRREVATGVEATEAEWDVRAKQLKAIVKGCGPELAEARRAAAQDANAVLLAKVKGANDAWAYLKEQGGYVTADHIKRRVAASGTSPLTLLALADAFYENESRPGAGVADNTLKGLRSRRRILEEYLRLTCQATLLAAAVDLPWVRKFERWCVDHRGYTGSTARKHINTLQRIISFGAHEGKLSTNEIADYHFQTPVIRQDPAYLPEAELQLLAKTEFTRSGLSRVADAWLFCAYTGLAYVDYMAFDPAQHLHTDASGIRWIRMTRQKSKVKFSMLLLEEAAAILDRYKREGGLPKFSNQHFNDELKIVSQVCYLSLPLTVGLARHTFSQRIRDMGFSDEVTASMAGHDPKTMNLHYSRIREARIAGEYEKLKGRLPTAAPATLAEQLLQAMQDPAQAQLLRQLILSQNNEAA